MKDEGRREEERGRKDEGKWWRGEERRSRSGERGGRCRGVEVGPEWEGVALPCVDHLAVGDPMLQRLVVQEIEQILGKYTS